LRILILLAVLLVPAAGAGLYLQRHILARQWAVYRVGVADSYEASLPTLASLETEPDRDLKLRELVRKWGTGNAAFDRYLARYVGDPASSEALREAFSLNLSWRDGLLSRWAHYWSWRPGPEPESRARSLLAHLELLTSRACPPPLTWREVLDLQALFTLTGQPRLALRLSPENWLQRYRQWRAASPQEFPKLVRPATPFAE
jgi:hypothetical protein